MIDRLPSVPARWCLAAAGVTWLGVVVGLHRAWMPGVVVACAAALILRRIRGGCVLVVLLVLGSVSGVAAHQRVASVESAALPDGRRAVEFTVVEESSESSWGVAVGEVHAIDRNQWSAVRIAVEPNRTDMIVGSTVSAVGVVGPGTRRVRGEIVAATFTVDSIEWMRPPGSPIVVAANAVRSAVQHRYGDPGTSDGLLRGFLIGDTDVMTASDNENLRRSGLSHFTAVSGSNVALFLVLWWFVTAPLSIHPRLRVLIGAVGLWLFVVITRWEASVIRAAVMAAAPLAGGLVGVPVDPWMALGTAVTVLLLVSGHLVGDLGFQLSVLATAGVLTGLAATRGRKHRWLAIPLATTLGAQAAVAPVLLATFGTVPLLAPLANLIAAPVVAGSTVLAAIGVVIPPVATVARVGGGFVLATAARFADGPQLGPIAVLLAGVCGSAIGVRATRPLGIAVGGLVVVSLLLPQSDWPTRAQVTVLDVGQGDAILIQAPGGESMLVDGGSEPHTLERALRRHGVRRVGTVVATHGDLDHVGGLGELIDAARTDALLVSSFGGVDLPLVHRALAAGVPVRTIGAGDSITVGSVEVDVLAPRRRFKSTNDGSIVLFVDEAVSVLLPGDSEAVALNELPPLSPEVLVVPHHGSSSTDIDWLRSTRPHLAILSYGPNRYGHPHPTIIETLEEMGVDILHTAIDGDIEITLGR